MTHKLTAPGFLLSGLKCSWTAGWWGPGCRCSLVVALAFLNLHLGESSRHLSAGKQAVPSTCGGREGPGFAGPSQNYNARRRVGQQAGGTVLAARHDCRSNQTAPSGHSYTWCSPTSHTLTWAIERPPHGDVEDAATHRQQQGAHRVAPIVLAQLQQRDVADLR